MPAPNFRQALAKAIAKIEEMLPSRGKRGEALGSTLAPYAVTTVFRKLRQKHEETELRHIQEVHAHHNTRGEVLKVNLDGDGVRVANIYQGSDGNFYKHAADGNWYCWEEKYQEWEQV